MATVFFQRVEALCVDRGMTTTDLGPAAGIGNGTISGWRNKDAMPGVTNIKKVADFFKVSEAYLRGETDDPIDYVNMDVSGFRQPLYDHLLKKCKGNTAQANREYVEFEKKEAEDALNDPDRLAVYHNHGGNVGVMGTNHAPVTLINGKERQLSDNETAILRLFAELDTVEQSKVLVFAAELKERKDGRNG